MGVSKLPGKSPQVGTPAASASQHARTRVHVRLKVKWRAYRVRMNET